MHSQPRELLLQRGTTSNLQLSKPLPFFVLPASVMTRYYNVLPCKHAPLLLCRQTYAYNGWQLSHT